MPTELFLTGATGFIGSGLLQQWLDGTDARITALVRPKRGVEPGQRVRELLSQLYAESEIGALAERVSVAEGDLTRDRFGLPDRDYERLTTQITNIVHCAAAVRFDLSLEDARRSNCGGAQNALDLAAACRQLRRMDYVGTAYVAGTRRGLIREEELDLGQSHNNTYERSKFEAEHQVRAAMARLPISIFRPTIVLGDSRTGRLSAVGAFFRVFRMYMMGQLPALPGDPATPMDLVSLDYTAAAVFEIARHPESTGTCFHIGAGTDNLTTLGELADLAARHFGRERFVVLPPEVFAQRIAGVESRMSEDERKRVDEIRIYAPYLAGDWHFDDSNTRAALSGTGLRPSKVSDYFGKMAAHVKSQH
jgi:thioester reductase-like protein